MDSTRHVVFLAIVLLLMCGLSFAQTAKNISCYTCSDFNPGNGIPPCNGVPDSSYPKVLCPYGFCYYSEYNFYFNDTILSIPENTSFINRGCYEPNTTFPEDWPSLGINQTRDCLVSDFYVLSFNKDAVHEYDCTCNTDYCNGNGAPGIPSVPPPSTLPLACYSCSDFTGGGIPNCTGVSATNYPKVICPSGYCYYGENTLYFNDTYIQQPENTRFIIRGCYDDSDGTFPDGWFNLGINKTWVNIIMLMIALVMVLFAIKFKQFQHFPLHQQQQQQRQDLLLS
uniref:Uncharacterized protein n=1 Tax=Acrobeloides nanus TaxID=290746 RepID=A0A914D1Y6_9BILA